MDPRKLPPRKTIRLSRHQQRPREIQLLQEKVELLSQRQQQSPRQPPSL
jgi:hypothetical protein